MSSIPPIDTRAVAHAGMLALQKGDAQAALGFFDQIVAAGRADATLWLAIARARSALGDKPGRLAAIDEALKLEPRSLGGVMMKGDHFAEAGDHRTASVYYTAVARAVPPGAKAPPEVQQEVARAQAAVERFAREFEDYIRAELERAGFAEGKAPARFSRAVDILVGKRQAYQQEPRYLFYPELAPAQFFAREAFPFLDRVEAAYADVRSELEAVLAESNQFAPYVEVDPRRPDNTQRGLAGNPSWSAYYMIKEGSPGPGAVTCPKTMEAVAEAPLCSIEGRAPGVLFSRLTPGAVIPPHTGVLNARLICHLPLIVPEGCEFRVGNEQYAWVEGKAWVFDDTIEHEAWNRSDRDRTILIFDIWRPDVSEDERAAIVALCRVVDQYGGAATPWDA
ncbi:MAG: aspartyl/asparaginyl beta-hydroxylase domain-containing protein [Hyphomonadaceae bacterium]